MFTGKLARIDLDDARVEIDPISQATLRDYLGGRGLNMRLLFHSLSRPGDPFDPRSPIVFSHGLMCGIPSLGSRMSISARSPETGFLGDANMGGELGAELKASGISSLFITGRSSRPVYIWVHDQTVEIRDASKLWGRDPIQTQQDIRKELADGEIKVGCIGLAGENRVRFAGVRSGLKIWPAGPVWGRSWGLRTSRPLLCGETGTLNSATPKAIWQPIRKYSQSSLGGNGSKPWGGGEHHCSCRNPIPRVFLRSETISSRRLEKRALSWGRNSWIDTLRVWYPVPAVQPIAGTAIR